MSDLPDIAPLLPDVDVIDDISESLDEEPRFARLHRSACSRPGRSAVFCDAAEQPAAEGRLGSLWETVRVQEMSLQRQSSGALPEAIRQGQTQTHIALGLSAEQDIFDYLTAPLEGEATFAASMSDATGMVIEDVVVPAVDLGRVKLAVVVGGAHGTLVLAMMQGSPAWKV